MRSSREVTIPVGVWLHEVERTDASAFSIGDPTARFDAVNAPHRNKAIPLVLGDAGAVLFIYLYIYIYIYVCMYVYKLMKPKIHIHLYKAPICLRLRFPHRFV